MWRIQTSRQGRQIVKCARRHLATETSSGSAPPPPSPMPPPKPKAGGRSFLKFVGLSVPLAAGGLLAYVWYDQEFRKQMEMNVPFAKEALEYILPVETPVTKPKTPIAPALDNLSKQMPVPSPPLEQPKPKEELNKSLSTKDVIQTSLYKTAHCTAFEKQEFSSVEKNESGNLNNSHDANVSYTQTYYAKTAHNTDEASAKSKEKIDLSKEMLHEKVKAKSSPEKETKAKKEAKSGPSQSEIQAELKRKAEEDRADNAALEVVIHKLLTSSHQLVEEAIKAQMDVANTTRNHTKLLRQAMDDTADILDKDAQWQAVVVTYKEKENAVVRANELVAETKKKIDKLRDVLAESKSSPVTKNNPAIDPATKRIAELTKELNAANTQVRHAESESKVMTKYSDLVDKAKKQFQKELEALCPDVKTGKASRKLSEEDLNNLLAHAYRRIEQLQKQLAEQLAMEQQRLNVALDLQKQEDKVLAGELVSDEKARLMNDFETEKHKWQLDFLVQQEIEVRKQLALQAAAHSDHLKDVLSAQSEELDKQFERNLNAKIIEEREKFQTEVASWIGRLKGIESAIDARAANEKLARYAQDLWLACISLNSSIHFGGEEENVAKPIKSELQAILKAANKHPFVESVAKTIPEVALERGVYTEVNLKDRFSKVSTTCRRVGLLTDANRSLYKYLISFLHSYFVFDNVRALSEKDLVNVEEFDNFDLVAHAQYWIDRGNLEMALRYMNQLKGESYVAASDWIKEVKLLLETRQAASTLTAYASATGLANTF